MKLEINVNGWLRMMLIFTWIAVVTFGVAASADDESVTAPTDDESMTVSTDDESMTVSTDDESMTVSTDDESMTVSTVDVKVVVEKIKRLRTKTGYIVATLRPLDDERKTGPKKVAIVKWGNNCKIGDTCANATVVFEQVASQVLHVLVLCHKTNRTNCVTGEAGELEEIGVKMNVTPKPGSSTFTVPVSLKGEYDVQ